MLQVQPDGHRAPITYASCALSETEKMLCTNRERSPSHDMGIERFQQYLLGRQEPFTLETDHKPLLPIMNAKDLNQYPPRLQRLKMRLARFYFQVQYVPGKELSVSDALSRAPIETLDEGITDEMETYVNAISLAGLPVSDVLLKRFVKPRRRIHSCRYCYHTCVTSRRIPDSKFANIGIVDTG